MNPQQYMMQQRNSLSLQEAPKVEETKDVQPPTSSYRERADSNIERVRAMSISSKPITIRALSWNVGNAVPDDDLSQWLGVPSHLSDLICIGAQECDYKTKTMDNCENDWHARLSSVLGKQYESIAYVNLMQIRLIVFARKTILYRITRVHTSSEATGVGNVVGNKGGVAVGMFVDASSIVFVNSHLAAHQTKVAKRNDDYSKIIAGLKLGDSFQLKPKMGETLKEGGKSLAKGFMGGISGLVKKPMQGLEDDGVSGFLTGVGKGVVGVFTKPAKGIAEAARASAYHKAIGVDILAFYDHVVWVGDLNYRLDFPDASDTPSPALFSKVTDMINAGAYAELFSADQLKSAIENQQAFVGFSENVPSFKPTFKVAREKGVIYKDQRLPSYCDRVLHRSLPNCIPLSQTAFNSVEDISSSDHKPVFGCFDFFPRSVLSDGTSKYVLRISFLSCRNLAAADLSGFSDPFVHFTGQAVDGDVRTTVVSKSLNPDYSNEDIPDVPLLPTTENGICQSIVVLHVLDRDKATNETLGHAILSLGPLLQAKGGSRYTLDLLRFGLPSGSITFTAKLLTCADGGREL